METYTDFEGLLEEIKAKLPPEQSKPEALLADNRAAIRDFLTARGIRYLVVPVEQSEVGRVRGQGIMPRETAHSHARQSTMTGAKEIALYITTVPADAEKNFKTPVWAVIDARCLYEDDTTFTYYDRLPSEASAKHGTDLAALCEMFASEKEYVYRDERYQYQRKDDRRLAYETTDPMACITLKIPIPADKILFFWNAREGVFATEITK